MFSLIDDVSGIFKSFFKFMLISSSLLGIVESSPQELALRNDLFTNYDTNVRPVVNTMDNVSLTMGIATQTLESFNQKEETMMLNIWLRMNWVDTNLQWDPDEYNISVLGIKPSNVWVPDIELLNAASIPDLYTLEGGMMLYSTGEIMWSRPGIFKFACQLDLLEFPFDRQNCVMNFGSWIFSDKYLDINPYEDESRQVDVLDTFSHSEWLFEEVHIERHIENRDCCLDEEFPIMSYHFQFLRYPHYYKLSMAMTITLVVVSFIIMLMEPDNVSRTGTAVFIPLTILALQLTISNKIPVVGYFTLMDKFFLCCFVLSMFCSIESGIIYALLTSKNITLFNLIKKKLDPDEFIKNTLEMKCRRKQILQDDEEIVQNSLKNINGGPIEMEDLHILENFRGHKIIQETIDIGNDLSQETETDFEVASNVLSRLSEKKADYRNDSYYNAVRNDTLRNRNREEVKKISDYEQIYKTIPYNDKILTLSDYELFIDFRLNTYIKRIDNVFRMILPIIFFAYTGYLLSYEKEIIE
jgi:hypothetical protein